MNSFGNIVIAVIFIDLVYSLFGNADRQIKRFFWKKEIKADEKTKREFRLHHIIQDLTALTVLIAFRLTENVAIIIHCHHTYGDNHAPFQKESLEGTARTI